jgi:hypothetical protein
MRTLHYTMGAGHCAMDTLTLCSLETLAVLFHPCAGARPCMPGVLCSTNII